MAATVVRCENLTKRYGKNRGVDELTFEVRPGQVFGFLGPNGAGKTTTIRCLLGLLAPSDGESFLFDNPVRLNDSGAHRRLGYVPGDVALFPAQTGRWTIDVEPVGEPSTDVLDLLERGEIGAEEAAERLRR